MIITERYGKDLGLSNKAIPAPSKRSTSWRYNGPIILNLENGVPKKVNSNKRPKLKNSMNLSEANCDSLLLFWEEGERWWLPDILQSIMRTDIFGDTSLVLPIIPKEIKSLRRRLQLIWHFLKQKKTVRIEDRHSSKCQRGNHSAKGIKKKIHHPKIRSKPFLWWIFQ